MYYCNDVDWVDMTGGTLSGLSCNSGETAMFDGSEWVCAEITYGGEGGLPVGCLAGQIPSWNGTAWACADPPSGGSGYEGPLVSGSKTGADCTLAGGTPYDIGSGNYVCYFPQNMLKAEIIFFIPTGNYSCPDGWSQYQNWSKTGAKNCNAGCSPQCTTGSHDFANTARETCSYRPKNEDGHCTGTSTCRANQLALGCI